MGAHEEGGGSVFVCEGEWPGRFSGGPPRPPTVSLSSATTKSERQAATGTTGETALNFRDATSRRHLVVLREWVEIFQARARFRQLVMLSLRSCDVPRDVVESGPLAGFGAFWALAVSPKIAARK